MTNDDGVPRRAGRFGMSLFHWLSRSVLLVLPLVTGCTGVNTFGTAARAGDTVVMAVGWQLELSRSGIDHIVVTDSAGASVVLAVDDPAVRSVFNAYPDPVSRLLVGAEVSNPSLYSSLIEGAVTSGDKEYSQSMIMLDLPQGLSPGQAQITVAMRDGRELGPMHVDVLPGVGGAATFENRENLSIGAAHLRSLERTAHYTVGFSGESIPFGIQLDLSHDPDASLGGVGVPYVVNPRGDIKNLTWRGDGTNLRIVLMPAGDRMPGNFAHFKFYVAGTLTGLQVVAVRGFDADGHPVPGVSATLE